MFRLVGHGGGFDGACLELVVSGGIFSEQLPYVLPVPATAMASRASINRVKGGGQSR